MLDQIIQLGLIKLAIVSVLGLLVGIYEAASKPIGNGWTPIVQEPMHQRIWNRLRRRGSTSIEVRENRVRIQKKAR